MMTLGIDVGTSGVRSAVLEDGELISSARTGHPARARKDVDARDWWEAVADCVDLQINLLRSEGRDPSDIDALAIDGTSGSMVLTDSKLRPVGPALMYNSLGFEAESERIALHAPDPHITRGSNSALARAMRLVSLAEGQAAHLLHQADFIASQFLGAACPSDYNNALKTGFDPAQENWPDWIGDLIDSTLLPRVVAPGTQLGIIHPLMAERFGLPATLRVMAGTTDSIAAFLASASLEEGVAVTSLGSTLAIKLLSRTRIDAPEIGLYAHRLGEFWLLGGASNTGGAVLASLFSPRELETLSARIDPSIPSHLDYYPLTKPGERFPINDPSLRPRLTPRPKEDHVFLHGLLASMSRIEARCYEEIIMRGGSRPKLIWTAGGGARNPVWTELRQQAIGADVRSAPTSEASIGAAKLAMTSL